MCKYFHQPYPTMILKKLKNFEFVLKLFFYLLEIEGKGNAENAGKLALR